MSAPALPWRALVVLAALGAGLGALLALADVHNTEAQNGWLIHTGPEGPAADLMAEDFPDRPQFRRGEHDGPMFYAIALHPFDLDAASEHLDRPQYRLQRPVFPLLARALNPVAEGEAFVWTMFAVGLLAMVGGGVALGALSVTLRGPPWPALVFGILPGAVMSLRITAADTLSVAFVVGAIVLSLRRHDIVAVVLAVLAVLAKEPAFIVLAGFAIWRRDLRGAVLAGVPAVVAGVWALVLRAAVPEGDGSLIDVVVPFTGLADSVELWFRGEAIYGAIAVVVAVGLGAWAVLRRGLDHPLAWPVAANLAFVVVWNLDVIGLERNAPRTVLALTALAVVLLVAPRAGAALDAEELRGRHRETAASAPRGDRSPQRA